MRILQTLARPPVILCSFIAMMLIGASFAYFQQFVGGDLLDMTMSGPEAADRLAEMSPPQKHAHFLITLVVDSLYPIAYGSFFAGATLKLTANSKPWLALPALITVVADFCENTVQMLALNGYENLLIAKSVFAPVKFSAFIISGLILLVCLLAVLGRTIKRRMLPQDE